jgi:hypothetical protein
MKSALLALAFLALSPSVHAQSLKMPLIVFAAAAASDQASTAYSWHRQPTFTEQDPLISWISRDTPALLITGSTVDIGTMWLARRLHRSHPKVAIAALYAWAAVRATVAAQNVYRARTFHGPTS